MRIGVCGALCALVLLALSGTAALAATPPFTAHGSAEQVYVTGLGSQQRAMLLNASGRTIQTANADSLGGLIFRNVKPGTGYYVEVTIPPYYEGHAYRTGSRIRVTITAPNGDQPIWAFGETDPTGKASVTVAFAKRMPSSLILPVVPGVSVPTGLPPCPGLRGEPCRSA